MNSPKEQNGNQAKRAAGEAIVRRFLGRYTRPGPVETQNLASPTRTQSLASPLQTQDFASLLYCGHLGSRTELEIRLWKYVESRLSEEEEQALESHADQCVYCQSRIRDIAKAAREAVRKPDLLLRLEKVTAQVKDSAGAFLADVLVAVENTGKWLCGALGNGLVLKPVPATRGLAKGPTRGPASKAGSGEGAVSTLTSSFKASTTIEGIPLSCEIRRSDSDLVASVDYSGAGLESGWSVICDVDATPVPPIRVRPGGAEFVIPQNAGRIELAICRQQQEIGSMVVEME